MGRQRKANKNLPERVYRPHRMYYFVDANNQRHKLGTEYPEAMAKYAEILQQGTSKNLSAVMDRYMKDVIPGKAPRTQKDNLIELGLLRAVFGKMHPDQVKPHHVYQYLDHRPPVRGRREKALLSHIFTKAIQWGLASANPCRLMHLDARPKRDRYIADEEFLAVRNLASDPIKLAMDLGYLTALRKGDLLRLTWRQISDEGIRLTTGKTGKKLLIEWSDELSQAIENCRRLPSRISSFYVLHNRNGQPYSESGFNSVWQRLQQKYAETGGERFRFHDIRRKSASDADAQHGREFARRLLSHGDQNMTAAYISGEQRIKPVK